MNDFPYQPLSLYNLCLNRIVNEPFIEKFYLEKYFNKDQINYIIEYFSRKKYVLNSRATYSIIPIIHTLSFGYINIVKLRENFIKQKNKLKDLKDLCLETIYKNNIYLFNKNTNITKFIKDDINKKLLNRKDKVFEIVESRSSITISKKNIDRVEDGYKNALYLREFIKTEWLEKNNDIVYEFPLIIKVKVKILGLHKHEKSFICSSYDLINIAYLEKYFKENYMNYYRNNRNNRNNRNYKFVSSLEDQTSCKMIHVNYEQNKLDTLPSYKYINDECLLGDNFNIWLRISYIMKNNLIKFRYDLEMIETITPSYDFNFSFDDF